MIVFPQKITMPTDLGKSLSPFLQSNNLSKKELTFELYKWLVLKPPKIRVQGTALLLYSHGEAIALLCYQAGDSKFLSMWPTVMSGRAATQFSKPLQWLRDEPPPHKLITGDARFIPSYLASPITSEAFVGIVDEVGQNLLSAVSVDKFPFRLEHPSKVFSDFDRLSSQYPISPPFAGSPTN